MESVTLPTTIYNPAGVNGFPAPAVDLFRYENLYRNSTTGFNLEFRQQILALREQGLKPPRLPKISTAPFQSSRNGFADTARVRS